MSIPTQPPKVPRRTTVTRWLLRIVAVLLALDVLVQALLAGRYLDGDIAALDAHDTNAETIGGLFVLQFLIALSHWLIGRGRRWPALVSLAAIPALHQQFIAADNDLLYLHIPLGVAILTAQIGIAAWTFTAPSGVSRPPRRAAPTYIGRKDSQHSEPTGAAQ